MSKRKESPSLLENILDNVGKPQSEQPRKQEVKKAVKQELMQTRKEDEPEKAKATYMLPTELLRQLERAFPDVRSHTRGRTPRKVSKSDVIAAALYAALEDLEESGRAARVIEIMIELKNEGIL